MTASRVPRGVPAGGQFAASAHGEATVDLTADQPVRAACPQHGGQWGDDETCEFCVDDNGDTRPVPDPITDDERVELAELEANFEASGGRGVEMADRIDQLRAKELMADTPSSDPADEIKPGNNARPYGDGLPWNSDIDRRRLLELGFAEQLAGTTWGETDPRQLARRVYEGVAMYRGIPTDAAAEGSAEATERGDDMLYRLDEEGPATAADRGRSVYAAVRPIIDAVQEKHFRPTGFVSTRDPIEPTPDEPYEETPTREDVDAAKAYLDSLEMPRPMYRQDWERINGGHGPTLAQARADAEYRGERSAEIARARQVYEEMKAAWEADGAAAEG